MSRECLKGTKNVSYRLSDEGLLRIEHARTKKGWDKQEQIWADAAHVSLATLRRFLERPTLHGRKIGIRQGYFASLCQVVGIADWKSLAEPGNVPVDDSDVGSSTGEIALEEHCIAYDRAIWVGRGNLINDLAGKLQNRCRLLVIVGITGIGKTALAERTLIELQRMGGLNKLPIHENLDDEGKAYDFTSFAIRLLETCGQIASPQEKSSPAMLLSRLIRYLERASEVIVIDSSERLLEGNELEGWNEFKDKWFIKFFQNILSSDTFKSRFILTSQDFPGDIQSAGDRYQQRWHSTKISGLTEGSQIQLFEKVGIDLDSQPTTENYVIRIGKAYEGHPLALKIIAREIFSHPFSGNITAYWDRYGKEIEEIEKAMAEVKVGKTLSGDDYWKIDRFTENLRRRVRHRLAQTFDRLKIDCRWAYILLCEASVYRSPVKEEFWLQHLGYWNVPESDQKIAMSILRDRFLIEEEINDDQYLVRLHNLVRSVALEHVRSWDKEV